MTSLNVSSLDSRALIYLYRYMHACIHSRSLHTYTYMHANSFIFSLQPHSGNVCQVGESASKDKVPWHHTYVAAAYGSLSAEFGSTMLNMHS